MSGAIVLQFPFRPSFRFALLLLLLHLSAASVAAATAIALPLKLLLLLLVVFSLFYFLLRDVLLLLPASWREITLDQQTVSVLTGNGSFSGRLADQTLASPYFIVLTMLPEGRRRTVSRVIFPDSLRPGAFRELCVHLKFA